MHSNILFCPVKTKRVHRINPLLIENKWIELFLIGFGSYKLILGNGCKSTDQPMDLRLPICIELEIPIISPRLEASAEAYLASEDTDRYA